MKNVRTILRHVSAILQPHQRIPVWPVLTRHACSLSHTAPPRLPRSLRTLCTRSLCTAAPPPSSDAPNEVTPLARQLAARVRATGAMTVAEYMNEVLVHPLEGYYTRQREVGQAGDFVTAPEIASMYGEMLGVWLVHEWQKLGAPQPLQLVELGPGRGTLMADILRVVNRLVGDVQLSVHLVEVSRTLAETQARTLGVQLSSSAGDQSELAERLAPPSGQSEGVGLGASPPGSQSESCLEPTSPAAGQSNVSGTCDLLQGTSRCGRDVTWHARLGDVPEAFSLIVANEFFDAMPVHQFRRTDAGWREVLIDLSDEQTAQFRFVLARGRTPACVFIDEEAVVGRDELEVSPRAAVLAAEVAERVAAHGGAALVCDYGHTGDRGDTLRAFRKHKCVDPLLSPGGADITCDVDFSQLARAAGEDVLCFGPVEQRRFLLDMGLNTRMERLLASCPAERAERLRAAYNMLTGDMGERFKMWALLPATAKPILDRFPPPGFTTPETAS